MLEANRLVLEDLERGVEGELDDASRVEGRVAIAAGAKLERSVVRGPAVIGEGARIVDSYVGPYTSIAAGRRDRRLRGRALDPARRRDPARPRRARWRRACSAATSSSCKGDGMPKTLRMIVGDNAEITIP